MAKEITTAEYQNIVYTEYLPLLLGPVVGPYPGCNPFVSTQVTQEFSTAQLSDRRFEQTLPINFDACELATVFRQNEHFDPQTSVMIAGTLANVVARNAVAPNLQAHLLIEAPYPTNTAAVH